ncbi:MAG: BON domain-containing protein [Planctomycetota bacterium]
MTGPESIEDPIQLDSSDVELQLKRSFEQLGYSQLNGITGSVSGTEILLTGVLDSFYLKQVAQSVAVKIAGIHSVRNEIEVR